MEKLIFQTEAIEDFYDLREELGRGNFAVVKRCQKKETGEEYAAKCITKKRSKTSKRGMSKDAIETEARLLLALDHDAIIKLYDVFETKLHITLIMELLTGGELFEEIAKQEFILEKDACCYTKQILDALQHMHRRNIVHLDLKPENIVLHHPGSKKVKLIDFGLAKSLEPGKEIREMMGTPEFAAPEVINYEVVGFYTDMWALGVVTYIILSGASPFLGDDDQETYKNITCCEYQFDDEYFDKITHNAKDFIEKLLVKKTKDRNTVQDCLNHPWIAMEESETSVIDTQKMRAFVARRRWKQSLKLVSTISRLKVLYRNSIPSPTSDVSGDEGSSIASPTSSKTSDEMDSGNFFSPGEEIILKQVPTACSLECSIPEGVSVGSSNIDTIKDDSLPAGATLTEDSGNQDQIIGSWLNFAAKAEFNTARLSSQAAVVVPFAEPENGIKAIFMNTEKNNDGVDSWNEKREGTLLPEQTVTALSENLPWDPEGDFNKTNGEHHFSNNLSLNGLKIPKLQEQLVPDVKLRTKNKAGSSFGAPVESESLLHINSKNHFSGSKLKVDRLSPDMAEVNAYSCLDGNDNRNKSHFDRKKQRTIRRINWETNYIPPLDFVQQSQPSAPVPVRRQAGVVGKETSV